MAMFAISAMAVVIAVGTAARVHQVARGVVLVPQRRVSGGEGPHQGTLALGQAQPVVKGLLSRTMAGPGVLHQREGPQPPSWAPQPSDFALLEGEGFVLLEGEGFALVPVVGFGAESLGGVAACPRGALPGGGAASADGAARAAAESTALARPWRRRSARGIERRTMGILLNVGQAASWIGTPGGGTHHGY
jgi:hypothetical protein